MKKLLIAIVFLVAIIGVILFIADKVQSPKIFAVPPEVIQKIEKDEADKKTWSPYQTCIKEPCKG